MAAGVLLMAGCASKTEGYTLEGTIENAGERTLLLHLNGENGWVSVDTLKLENGQFVATGKLDHPVLLSITIDGKDRLSFFGADGQYRIVAQADSLSKGTVQSEVPEAQLYARVAQMQRDMRVQQDQIAGQYNRAKADNDTAKMSAALGAYEALGTELDRQLGLLVDENKQSPVSAYLVKNIYGYGTAEEIQKGLAMLDTSLTRSPYVKAMQARLHKLEQVSVGRPAPDFSMADSTGVSRSLSELKGKVVLIDFWASWCGPCRRENPNVVKVYQQFKDKNFTILGVSLDQKRDNWLKAISDDRLTWNHVSDLAGWQNSAAQLYGVNSIPHTVLIDASGVILARNLSSDELAAKLSELLK